MKAISLNRRILILCIAFAVFASFMLCGLNAYAEGKPEFSAEEQSWIDNHDTLIVGYMNNYMPFSATTDNGGTTGIVVDVVPHILQNLGIEDKLAVKYIGYDDNSSMYAALRDGEIDAAFPTYGERSFAESNGAEFTDGIIEITVDLAYKGDYTDDVTRRISVNRYNHLQEYYTMQYYPEAEIIYFDDIKGCLDAVAEGGADSTLLNGFRTRALISGVKYANFNVSQVPGTIELCFAVEKNNSQLLSILNKAIDNTEKAAVTAFTYGYVNAMNSYTVNDFIRDNMLLVVSVIAAFFAILAAFVITKVKSKESKKELLQRIELKKQTERVKSVISAMAEDFDYINSTNLKTGEITRYLATDKFYQVESGIDRRLPAGKRLEIFFKTIVHPSEWDRFVRLTSSENLKNELAKNPIYKFECLTVSPDGQEEYYRFKFAYIPDEPNIRIMGLLNIDDNVRREQELAIAKERVKRENVEKSLKIIDTLSSDFGCVNYVSIKDNGEAEVAEGYRTSDLLTKVIPGWDREKQFTKRMQMLAERVYEPDREEFRRKSSRDRILEELRKNDVYFINTRMLIEDEIRYYQMKFSPIMEEGRLVAFVAGLHSIDEQMKNEIAHQQELEAQMARVMELSDNFQAICDVDMESGKYDIYSCNSDYAGKILSNMANGNDFFADAHKDSDNLVYFEDRDLVKNTFGNKEYIKKTLDEKGEFTIDYRMNEDGEPVWYRVKIVKKDGEEGHFLAGVFFVDEGVRREEEQRKADKERIDIIQGLASAYNTIYYINLDTGEYSSRVLSDEVDFVYDYYAMSSDYEKMARRYVENLVHPDDQLLLIPYETMSGIKELLAHKKVDTVRFRRKQDDGYIWMEQIIIKSENLNDEAHYVISAFADRDSIVRAEME